MSNGGRHSRSKSLLAHHGPVGQFFGRPGGAWRYDGKRLRLWLLNQHATKLIDFYASELVRHNQSFLYRLPSMPM